MRSETKMKRSDIISQNIATIDKMIEAAKEDYSDANLTYEIALNKKVEHEDKLHQAENKKEKNYFKLWKVSKAIIKMIFKQPKSSEEVKRAIKPIRDYQEAIEDISILKENVENANSDVAKAENEVELAEEFLELLCILRNYATVEIDQKENDD